MCPALVHPDLLALVDGQRKGIALLERAAETSRAEDVRTDPDHDVRLTGCDRRT
jgi:hypothetical protein